MTEALSEFVVRRFDEIAKSELEWERFRVSIGEANAPSRLTAAAVFAACGHVLDIGCGPGVFRQSLDIVFQEDPDFAPEYTGCDASLAMIDRATAGLPDDLFLRAPAEKLPFKERRYDGVLIRHLLEHLENPRQALAEAMRVCSDRLVLVFSQWPTFSAPTRLMVDTDMRVPRFAHNGAQLLAQLEADGFSVTMHNYVPGSKHLSVREALWVCSRKPLTNALSEFLRNLEKKAP